jgi:hypothetical protein
MDDTGTKAVTSDLCHYRWDLGPHGKSPPQERPAAGFLSGYIPEESTACGSTVNLMTALAYGVIAEAGLRTRRA